MLGVLARHVLQYGLDLDMTNVSRKCTRDMECIPRVATLYASYGLELPVERFLERLYVAGAGAQLGSPLLVSHELSQADGPWHGDNHALEMQQ